MGKKMMVAMSFMAMLLVPGNKVEAAFDKTVGYGARGASVAELQEFLADQGLYKGPISGSFYAMTQSAVKAFQKREGIKPVSGLFGPVSRARALVLTAPVVEEDIEETLEPIAQGSASFEPVVETPSIPLGQIQPLQPGSVAQPLVPVQVQPVVVTQPQQPVMNQPEQKPAVHVPKPWAEVVNAKPMVQDLAYSTSTVMNEEFKVYVNTITLGFILHADENPRESVRDAIVTIETTDPSQNKVLNGTPSIRKFPSRPQYNDEVYVYMYEYTFKTPGTHVINFKAKDLGVEKSFTIDVE